MGNQQNHNEAAWQEWRSSHECASNLRQLTGSRFLKEQHAVNAMRTAFEAGLKSKGSPAAPDLLESLTEMLEDMGIDPDASPEGYSKRVQKALATIKKARGGATT